MDQLLVSLQRKAGRIEYSFLKLILFVECMTFMGRNLCICREKKMWGSEADSDQGVDVELI